MLIRPYGSERFLVDIAKGDILSEAGDVLVVGRPKGLRSSTYRLEDPALWRESDLIKPLWRQPLQYSRADLPWREVYAFPYRPKSRERLPVNGHDLMAFRYFHVRLEMELLLGRVGLRHRGRGGLKVGLAPLSWRKPEVVAHIMAEALTGLFFVFRDRPESESLTVVIRSLDEPHELARVFDREYFKEWRRRMGWPPMLRDIWLPA